MVKIVWSDEAKQAFITHLRNAKSEFGESTAKRWLKERKEKEWRRLACECAVKKEAGVNLIHSCLLMIAECGGALCAAYFGYFAFKVMSQGFGLSVEPKRVALSPMALKRRSCK